MKEYGFVRVAAATIESRVSNCNYNTTQIIEVTELAIREQISLIVFPELSITSYTCNDLFFQNQLILDALHSLIKIKEYSKNKNISIIVGLPIKISSSLYNCSAFICNGLIYGLVPKTTILDFHEINESRWFTSGNLCSQKQIEIDGEMVPFGSDLIFTHKEMNHFKVGIEISEDLWSTIPPSIQLTQNGATIIANPAAIYETINRNSYTKQLVSTQSSKTISAYIYASAGFGESTTDLVFGGSCFVYENNKIITENKGFQLQSNFISGDIDLEKLVIERLKSKSFYNCSSFLHLGDFREIPFELKLPNGKLNRLIKQRPFVPEKQEEMNLKWNEIFSIQTHALAKRLKHIHCNKVIIGVSGGLDSTLALLVCVQTFKLLKIELENILAVTMPGFGTTNRTFKNATSLIEKLEISTREISIKEACLLHFKSIGHDANIHDTTYENVQARERTQILMDLANKENAIVIGTGDLSESALGWSTYNGDHMSMYNVNASIPKTMMTSFIGWISSRYFEEDIKHIIDDILLTPVSPELLPPTKDGIIQQKTEESIGPYELHDFFLYYLFRFGFRPSKILYLAKIAFQDLYSDEIILKWLKIFYKRFFSQQFKRSCMPDGPKVGSVSLSPRGSLSMPSDGDVSLWIQDLEDSIKK